MTRTKRHSFEYTAIVGTTAVIVVVLGQVARLASRASRQPSSVFVSFLWALVVCLPVLAIGIVLLRIVGNKVRRRLEDFRAQFPAAAVVGIGDQAGFAAGMRRLGVSDRRRLVVGVLVCDADGITIWRGFAQPHRVLHIDRDDILGIDEERVQLGGFKSRARCILNVTAGGHTTELPLYFQAESGPWYNIAGEGDVAANVRAITRSLNAEGRTRDKAQ